ncbi:hypothetical protein L208DRAFT_1380606 [Tricholoma matsutake]|nr:hypothetical protein L208DRAFT_1380606 [Tricholoma matsutake 945]
MFEGSPSFGVFLLLGWPLLLMYMGPLNLALVLTFSKLNEPTFTLYYHVIAFYSSTSSIDSKQANWGKNMVALIEEEGLDKDGLPEKRRSAHCQHKCKCKQAKKVVQGEDDNDNEDSEFLSSGSGDLDESGSESDLNGSDGMIPNDEIADMLPLKMAPCTKQTKSTAHSQQMNPASGSSTASSMTRAKKKSCKTTVEEILLLPLK